jgi:hypothetical protein
LRKAAAKEAGVSLLIAPKSEIAGINLSLKV